MSCARVNNSQAQKFEYLINKNSCIILNFKSFIDIQYMKLLIYNFLCDVYTLQ